MVISLRSTTEATIGHLETSIIAKKEKTSTGQFKRQGEA
jgi:hypothetical protein